MTHAMGSTKKRNFQARNDFVESFESKLRFYSDFIRLLATHCRILFRYPEYWLTNFYLF